MRPRTTRLALQWWRRSGVGGFLRNLRPRTTTPTWLDRPAAIRIGPTLSLFLLSLALKDEGLDDARRYGLISPEEHAIMIDLSTALRCHKAPGGNSMTMPQSLTIRRGVR